MLLSENRPSTVPEERLEKASLSGETLLFEREDGLEQALRMGFFLVKIPEALDIRPAMTLGQHFNEPCGIIDDGLDMYRGFREQKNLCFDRKNYQVEQLIIGQEDRKRLLPADAYAATSFMSGVAVSILRALLRWFEVDEADWSKASGGCASGGGTHWFVANYYKSGDEALGLGCAPHTDTGFVTVLYADRPGLEVGLDGEWRPIAVEPEYFIVNFGAALETLTRNKLIPARAALHRVSHTAPIPGAPPRVSLAAFASAPTHGVLYEVMPDGGLQAAHDVDRFLKAHDAGTWDETRKGLSQSRSTESVRSTTDIAYAGSRIGA